MDDFKQFLAERGLVLPRRIPYHISWVRKFLSHTNQTPDAAFRNDDIAAFLERLGKTHEQWQVTQAEEALRLYRYFLDRGRRANASGDGAPAGEWRDAWTEMRRMLRLRQLSMSTEKTYQYWLRLCYRFIRNTMIYTHVAGRNILGVRSPLD
jgi:hypothetical protein